MSSYRVRYYVSGVGNLEEIVTASSSASAWEAVKAKYPNARLNGVSQVR